jgi:hypothetical protein
MGNPATKILALAILLLWLALPSHAQNTKGDKPPQGRESRFRKVDARQDARKKKKAKKINVARKKEFRPSKKADAGDRAARPVTPLRNTNPGKPGRRTPSGTSRRSGDRSPGEGSKNVYGQKRLYVHNNAREPSRDDRRPIPNKRIKARIKTLSARQRPNNIFPQEGRFVNNPSKIPRSHPRGVSNRQEIARLKKLQGPEPKPRQKKRVVTRSASRSYTARKSINIVASYPRGKRKTEKAYTRDIAGRRLRTRNFESKKPDIVRSQAGTRYPFGTRKRSGRAEEQRFGKPAYSTRSQRPSGKGKITPRTSSSARKSISRSGAYMKNATGPRPVEGVQSNAETQRRLKQLRGKRPRRAAGRETVVPRSASGGFLSRKSTNTWAQFPRPKKKGERPYMRDIAGKKLRTRNYETPPRAVIQPDYKPYFGRKRVGDRPYSGQAGGYRSASRKKPRAWTGDIAGRKIRGIKTPREDRASTARPGGYRTTRIYEKRVKGPLPVKQPGIGATSIQKYRGDRKGRRGMNDQGEEFSGDMKARKRKYRNQGEEFTGNLNGVRRGYRDQGEEFSGSVKARRRGVRNQGDAFSGTARSRKKAYRNQGEEYPGNLRGVKKGFRDQGEQYSGSIKARKRANRNQGEESRGNLKGFRRGFVDQGEEFSGTYKTRRSPKGGGSVSGKLWNNQGTALPVKMPREQRPGNFTGTIKARRPLTGGGSVSGKLWNNRGQAIAVRTPKEDGGGRYQGNLKTTRQPKIGAQSISGKSWNNRGAAIATRKPPKRAAEVSGFPGKLRRFYDKPGFSDQGEEYTGSIKARKPIKLGGSVSGKLWNNGEKPLPVHGEAGKTGGYSGNIKLSRFRRTYVRNPNASADALSTRRPTKATFEGGNLQVRVARKAYVKNPNASDEALKKTPPSKSTFQQGELQSKTKRFDYVRNNSSSKYAMKTREPGKAFGRAVDYQGNIKMQKFTLFERNRELHPDAKFVKANKNNVPQEKDALTNLKLWWARLFKKNDTQPDHLKEKNRRPRYDKGEDGLWYD